MFNKSKNKLKKLTSYSKGAGWACKLGPEDLNQVLSGLNDQVLEDGILGYSTNDDCSVFTIDEKHKIIQCM